MNHSLIKCTNYFILSVSNNSQEKDISTLYTSDIQSFEQEITPKLERKNVSIKRNTERQENSEECPEKEHIANDNLIGKCSTTCTCDISDANTPDILVNQLHETIVEMKKCEDESFKREYSVSRRWIERPNQNKYECVFFLFSLRLMIQ